LLDSLLQEMQLIWLWLLFISFCPEILPKPLTVESIVEGNRLGCTDPLRCFSKASDGCGLQEKVDEEPRTGFEDRFRTSHGGYNNLKYPFMNFRGSSLRSETPPAFSQGRQLRKSITGDDLPMARHLSNIIFKNGENPTWALATTDLLVHFLQFVEHDLLRTKVEDECNCCPPDNNPSTADCNDNTDAQCIPIQISNDDPEFANKGVDCISMQRVMTGKDIILCRENKMNPLNFQTGWLDLDLVTGNDDLLRQNCGGLLKSSFKDDNIFLPKCKFEEGNGCPRCDADGDICCFSGDPRVSEQPHQTLLHTFFHRLLNHIALKIKNSVSGKTQSDEIIFQLARRHTVAFYQNIVYNEFLPMIIGPQLMKERNLFPLTAGSGYSTAYHENTDARPGVSWSTAYRSGHTMLKHLLTLKQADGNVQREKLSEFFLKGCSFIKDGDNMEKLFRGATSTYGAQPMNSASSTVKPDWFSPFENAIPGTNDKIAMDIMRARDFGAPSYNRARQFCQTTDFGSVGNFEDLYRDYSISEENVGLLMTLYGSVDDIDLLVGGILENPLPGAIVGPTFACLIADQFSRLKKGDRFYFEYETYTDPLGLIQIDEIRKTTFSQLACLVMPDLIKVNPKAFQLDQFSEMSCADYEPLTFGLELTQQMKKLSPASFQCDDVFSRSLVINIVGGAAFFPETEGRAIIDSLMTILTKNDDELDITLDNELKELFLKVYPDVPVAAHPHKRMSNTSNDCLCFTESKREAVSMELNNLASYEAQDHHLATKSALQIVDSYLQIRDNIYVPVDCSCCTMDIDGCTSTRDFQRAIGTIVKNFLDKLSSNRALRLVLRIPAVRKEIETRLNDVVQLILTRIIEECEMTNL